MSLRSLAYVSVALAAITAVSVLSPLAPWSTANAASACTSPTCPPPSSSSSSSSSDSSSSSGSSSSSDSSSSTPPNDGGNHDDGGTPGDGDPGDGGKPGSGNTVQQLMMISCEIPNLQLALRFRNIGDRVIQEGSRVTWRIAETGEHGTLLLPLRLAPGEKVTITNLLRHAVAPEDHCQAALKV